MQPSLRSLMLVNYQSITPRMSRPPPQSQYTLDGRTLVVQCGAPGGTRGQSCGVPQAGRGVFLTLHLQPRSFRFLTLPGTPLILQNSLLPHLSSNVLSLFAWPQLPF